MGIEVKAYSYANQGGTERQVDRSLRPVARTIEILERAGCTMEAQRLIDEHTKYIPAEVRLHTKGPRDGGTRSGRKVSGIQEIFEKDLTSEGRPPSVNLSVTYETFIEGPVFKGPVFCGDANAPVIQGNAEHVQMIGGIYDSTVHQTQGPTKLYMKEVGKKWGT